VAQIYPYTAPWALPWNFRKRNLLREVLALLSSPCSLHRALSSPSPLFSLLAQPALPGSLLCFFALSPLSEGSPPRLGLLPPPPPPPPLSPLSLSALRALSLSLNLAHATEVWGAYFLGVSLVWASELGVSLVWASEVVSSMQRRKGGDGKIWAGAHVQGRHHGAPGDSGASNSAHDHLPTLNPQPENLRGGGGGASGGGGGGEIESEEGGGERRHQTLSWNSEPATVDNTYQSFTTIYHERNTINDTTRPHYYTTLKEHHEGHLQGLPTTTVHR